MAECTHVILVFENGTSKVYDPAKIDSIFFDDEKAMCFATNCLDGSGGSGGPGSSVESLERAIRARGGGGGNPPAPGEMGGGVGEETQQATLTATAVAAEPTLTVAQFEPCIHMRDCTWDCGGENGDA